MKENGDFTKLLAVQVARATFVFHSLAKEPLFRKNLRNVCLPHNLDRVFHSFSLTLLFCRKMLPLYSLNATPYECIAQLPIIWCARFVQCKSIAIVLPPRCRNSWFLLLVAAPNLWHRSRTPYGEHYVALCNARRMSAQKVGPCTGRMCVRRKNASRVGITYNEYKTVGKHVSHYVRELCRQAQRKT